MSISPELEKELVELIWRVVPKAYKKTTPSPELSLSQDLGIDSMALVSFTFSIEETYGCNLIDQLGEKIFEIFTVGDVLDIVGELISRIK